MNGTILIVDDIPLNIQLAAQHLKSLNHRLIYATSGEMAIQQLKKHPVDLILLDVMMPELDGYDCCRRIRSYQEWKDIPVIFLTAKNEVKDIITGFEAGGSDYITKPFYGQELLARVKTHLELKQHRDLLARREVQLKEMLHILSHDLRNSLSGVTMTMDLAELEGKPLDLYRSKLSDLSANGLNLLDLVRTMMLLEEKPLQLVPVLLNECIKHCLHLLNPRIEAKEIRVVTDLDYDFVVLAEEVSLINSVLMNLLTNAIKFSHKGGVITVSASEDEESTCLRIIDEGTGIPEAMIPHLFNVEKGKSMKGTGGEKGSGFGLPLVKKFMTAYGGTIEMANREEGGAESKLTFPLLHEEAEEEL